MMKRLGWMVVALGLLAATPVFAQAGDSTKPSLSAGRQLQAKVWVNTANGVYHCPDSRYYGKTKAGEYMTEAKARGSGYHAAQGNGCGSAPATGTAAPLPGSAAKVWVNLKSGIYFCPDSKYFGKTKSGKYLSEAEAKTDKYRPAGGKACG